NSSMSTRTSPRLSLSCLSCRSWCSGHAMPLTAYLRPWTAPTSQVVQRIKSLGGGALPARSALVSGHGIALQERARARIRRAADAHDASVARVRRYLAAHPEPDLDQMLELRFLVLRAEHASHRLLDALQTTRGAH